MTYKLGITPGPWTWCGEEDGDFVVFKNSGDFICNVGDSPMQCIMDNPQVEMTAFDMTRANARLISAAPEMLEALIDATIEILNNDYNELEMKHTTGGMETVKERNRILLNVIEKATGKTWEEILSDISTEISSLEKQS